ncbi:hypothetical protein AGMMS49944_11680 [Spirochaetia bacterium]|nr:hypothetical protein AGMMS49944_11680 [Spirochaetia bacterium]
MWPRAVLRAGEKGEHDAAIADYSKAISIYPRYTDAYYNCGIAYILKGEQGLYDRAKADFAQAYKLDPDDVDAKERLELALTKLGY